jgi:hypothetical protein
LIFENTSLSNTANCASSHRLRSFFSARARRRAATSMPRSKILRLRGLSSAMRLRSPS